MAASSPVTDPSMLPTDPPAATPSRTARFVTLPARSSISRASSSVEADATKTPTVGSSGSGDATALITRDPPSLDCE